MIIFGNNFLDINLNYKLDEKRVFCEIKILTKIFLKKK